MKKETQPVLKLPSTAWEHALRIAALFAIASSFVVIALYYNRIGAASVPIHYDLSGTADGWGNKNVLWFVPTLVGALIIFLLWLSKRPHHFNYTVKITPENAEKYYRQARQMLHWLALIIGVGTFFITCQSIQGALGKQATLGTWFLPVFLLLLLAIVLSTFRTLPQKSQTSKR
ncbi:MAG TPA: DUF1648 domain-containing protein [Saprospiraceae bacterium]|nr:DUF1648 domain-containing protein [Saprospiraceae bacterium]HMP13267.1 DUF1648 domain-containing protein [Saprospiraceae bacterium]